MKQRLLQLLILTPLFAFSLLAQEGPIRIDSLTDDGLVTYDYERGTGYGTNGVVVRYAGAVLTADEIHVDTTTGQALAQGNVSLQRDDQLWRSERLEYNFRTRDMRADLFRTGVYPFFAAGRSLSADTTGQTYTATEAFVTSDDVSRPAYRLRARSLTVIPGRSVQARGATLYAGRVPVMYFPYYQRSLAAYPRNFGVTPGYRSLFGPFLLTSYTWYNTTNLQSSINLDYRQKRGVGLGPDLGYDLGRWGAGDLSGYYLRDDRPGTELSGEPIPSNRHRIRFTHQTTIRSNLTAKVVVREQGDPLIVRDFFESEYRANPQPKSFLEVNQLWSNYSLNFLAQPQLNDFQQTVERLPDLKLSGIRQQLGVSPFYYESETSAGWFRFQPAERSPLTEYSAMRADTFHQLLLPWTFFGWLNVTPRVGGRLTHYGEVDGVGATIDEQNRGVFNTGAEVSFKASQVWPGVRSRIFDVREVRHILQPSFNYVFVPSPTRAPRELPQFDTEIPSLRLLPIDFPDYNAIDSIDSQNVLRLGLRNKFQTKREGLVDNILNWALYTDWRIDPRRDQSQFSDVYSDFDLKPRSWLILSSELRYGTEVHTLRAANHWLTVTPNQTWSAGIGHRYFREDPDFGVDSANNLIRTSVFYRLNENWGVRMTHHFEARDRTLEEQYYTIYRDMRSWTGALTVRLRENRLGPDDFTIALTFSLKAFPRFRVGEDRDQHSLLLGG